MEGLLSTPNGTAVQDIAMSTGIPMTDKKMRRYIKLKHKTSLESNGEALPITPLHLFCVGFVVDAPSLTM